MDSPFFQLALAAGLGMLVGMQRERRGSAMAGVRTFTLITITGALCGLLAVPLGEWIVAVGMLGVIAMIVVSNLLKYKAEAAPKPGMTTEAASLVMFLVGVLPTVGQTTIAVVVTGVVALLLHLKDPLHKFAKTIDTREFTAIMQFVLIALVILPLLPDRTFGPLDVLNPYKIWLMVVLIVGISLAAYAAVKLLGNRVGALLAGVLGGLISSTATTVSYARKSRETPAASALAAAIILIASAIVFGRVLAEVALVSSTVLPHIAAPLLTVAAVVAALGAFTFWRSHGQGDTLPLQGNPSEMKTAVLFAALYAVILFAITFAREYLGQAGLYVVAALSGMTDMDAITLSTASMIADERLDASTGWRIILIAAMANIVFKGAAVFALGSAALRRHIAVSFGIILAAGAAVLVLWPEPSA